MYHYPRLSKIRIAEGVEAAPLPTPPNPAPMCATLITEPSPPVITLPHSLRSDKLSRDVSRDLTSRDLTSRDSHHLTKSLKPGKRKKFVKFADTVGLPLVQVGNFLLGLAVLLMFDSLVTDYLYSYLVI